MNMQLVEEGLNSLRLKAKDLGKPDFKKGDIITDIHTNKLNLIVTLIAPRLDQRNHYRVHARMVKWNSVLGAWQLNNRVGNREILWRNYQKHKIQNIKI